jgi:nucleosome binding factor SPN SPT16 subunit
MDIHDHIKLIKHGFSKVTDHACREIRHGRLTRDVALKLVRHYQDQPMKYINLFLSWLGMDEIGLNFVLSQHKTDITNNSKIHYHSEFNLNVDYDTLIYSKNNYKVNDTISMGFEDRYVVVGKGYP